VGKGELTIGALARQVNASTSMLRFYEREGLLKPSGRTDAGYRIYPATAVRTLLFIHRAQRLGFSLADIRLFLQGGEAEGVDSGTVMDIAQQRFVEIERRLTELLVLRHELDLFLDDLTRQMDERADGAASELYRNLLDNVCGHDERRPGRSSVAKLMGRLGCSLASGEREEVFAALRSRHVHVWRDQEGYSILIASQDPEVEAALRRLAASESACHAHGEPRVSASDEGVMLHAKGPNAFLFAQLFLALEAAET